LEMLNEIKLRAEREKRAFSEQEVLDMYT